MAGKQVILTQEGLEKLEQELEELKSVKRKEIAEKIKVALSFGDLSENSEYDEAKNEQAIMEARIADIEVTLKNVKVIDESELSNENIHIGSKVEVRVNNPRTGKTDVYNYKIVGSNEADPLSGNISDESAVGKALLGHGIGDKIEVEVPARDDGVRGARHLQIRNKAACGWRRSASRPLFLFLRETRKPAPRAPAKDRES